MEIYQPAEDSYLLSEVLSKEKINKKIKILDMGSGSGIQTETLISQGVKPQNITIVDINPEAVYLLQEKFRQSKVIKSNLFENIKGSFDLIIFNPPYLPENKQEPKESRLATTGGKKGSELIMQFLEQAKSHLNENGKIFLLISSLTGKIDFKTLGYKEKLLASKKIFMEELFVYELIQ